MSNHHTHVHSCCCCTKSHSCGVNRRDFMAGMGTLAAGGMALSSKGRKRAFAQEPEHKPPRSLPLKVQPVLIYHLPQRREQTSWRSWGGIQTAQDVAAERDRIQGELEEMQKGAEFPIDLLPLVEVQNADQAEKIAKGEHDVMLMYAACNGVNVLEQATNPEKWTIIFLRHRSGPVYLWYEIIHNRYLRKTVDEYGQPGVGNQDIVVDEYDEVLWRCRALYGLKNTLNRRIVTIGNPSGWGVGGQKAPELSKERFNLEYYNVSYDDLGKRIKAARQNEGLVKRCHNEAEQYIKQEGVDVNTSENFIKNAFVLNEVFLDLLDEAETDAFTINHCMGTVMPISETTACLPLTLLNDAGYHAYCESDFVVIPSGILLHYICSKPVFLNDPTFPHDGVVTLAHCTAPRRMNGEDLEPVNILTHFESDYGAAPKVEMKEGQKITVIDPDFNFKTWLGFEGEIIENPFLDICRSQIDVKINGDCDELNQLTKGFHWMACYGNYLKEVGYALNKVGIDWTNLS